MRWIMLALAGVLVAAAPPVSAVAEPAYTLLLERDGFELRRYSGYVVAEVEVEGSFQRAGNRAFRPLFDFISGHNSERQSIEMTAPVTQSRGQKIPMTAPVTQAAGSEGRHRVGFVMPAGMTLETTPLPRDPQVQLREVPEHTMAVLRYGGTWSAERYRKIEGELMALVREEGLEVIGEPVWARYNGPMTPWFMRRNEVMVEVTAPTR